MITAYCLAFEIVRLSALISREFTLAITHMENIIDYFIVSFLFWVNMGISYAKFYMPGFRCKD